MRLAWICAACGLLLGPWTAAAQVAGDNGRPQATAVRAPSGGEIRIDGRLDDAAWALATPLTEFVQKEPVEGAPPTERMEVRFVYDDEALIVGARLYNRQGPSAIQAPLSRRDEVDQAEYLLVALDPYLDRRTAYCFGVTASGVRLDHFHRTDSETDFDDGFDPVWRAEVRVDDQGWTAELWIPFSQLRFNDAADHVWGLNLHRRTPTNNEDDYWVAVPRTERAWSSGFGHLTGIRGIDPGRRIEMLPYLSGASTLTGRPDRRNPFDDGRNLTSGVGMDVKVGVGSNLTLDATINPDFGQVEADPAEVNLSNFETFFSERRPFFTEGSSLLTGGAINYFYSRRIGAVPLGAPAGDFVDHPRAATILGAAKLSGRLASGTSVGLLGAVTAGEEARTFDLATATIRDVAVAPRTTWAVARLLQEFGPSASTAGLMFTAVHRDLEPGGRLTPLLAENAFTLSGDTVLRLRGGEYEVKLDGGLTHVSGDPAAMLLVQRASPRYFQRPDATHVSVDPSRTSLTGGRMDASIERRNGRHWLWLAALRVEAPSLEHNDIGRLNNGDGIQLGTTRLTYRETEPGRVFRSYQITASANNEWTFGGDRSANEAGGSVQATFLNFWSATVSGTRNLRTLDWQVTRGGPFVQTPRGWVWTGTLRSRPQAETVWSATGRHESDEHGGFVRGLSGDVSLRPQPKWQLSLGPSWRHETNARQYVTTRGGGRPETFGSRYVFAGIERTTVSAEARFNYTFKPDLNLDVYAEPFAASGRYGGFGELLAARSRLLREYGTGGTTIETLAGGGHAITDGADRFVLSNRDFNVRSFRSNVVLRWEYRPGSTLYLVWQQDRMGSEAVGAPVGFGDAFRSLQAPGTNFLAVKVSFWRAG
ncbi:MAG: carbohydrate binding family 9 domain-containing protein [Acidimicrobiia bacterium]|nr:carbohydrate binding family 9 domain-containing protein [Acidimicrobiia bacterium]